MSICITCGVQVPDKPQPMITAPDGKVLKYWPPHMHTTKLTSGAKRLDMHRSINEDSGLAQLRKQSKKER